MLREMDHINGYSNQISSSSIKILYKLLNNNIYRMSKFRSRLSRYNTAHCEQVIPVPVIPVCAVSCCIPIPFCEYKPTPLTTLPPQPIAHLIDNSPLQILEYTPQLTTPTGSILTNTPNNTIPTGYLLANGSEISRVIYNQLFLAIGTQYGGGDGTTTFNLPNLSSDDADCVVSYIIKT